MDQINNPTSELVTRALGWTCDLCGAAKGRLCTNTLTRTRGGDITPDTPLPERVIHHARCTDRRREPKDD